MNSSEKEICREMVAQGRTPEKIASFLGLPLEEVLLASLSSASERVSSTPPLVLEHVGDINPSHETCEGCGALLSGVLSIQVWTCPECEFVNDRRL